MLTLVPPTDCIRAREAVSARLDGELSELEAQRLELHLDRCGPCREFAAELAAVAGKLRSAALEPAPAELFTPHRRRLATPAAAAAAALVVAVATGSSFLFGQFLARGGGGASTLPATTAAAATADPAFLAMLGNGRSMPAQRGRVIAL